jgi:polysaccharide chain length determinant protein (PEP-CTERM system associated)
MRREIHVETRDVDPGAARGETIAFAISFQGVDPGKVADVTNALANLYVEENLEARSSQTAGTADFIKSQLEPVKRRLDEQAAQLNAFNMRHMGELPQQVGVNLATLERLNAQLQQNRDQQNRILEKLDAPDRPLLGDEAAGAASVSESPDTRLIHLERQLAALRARFNDAYPDVVQIRSEIAALRRGGAAPGSPDRSARSTRTRPGMPGLGSALESLRSEERRLKDQIASYQAKVESAPGREQEISSLTRDYESTKDLYRSLLQRDEEARLADNLEKERMGDEIRILDPAVPSPLPAAPNRLRLLAIGLALSAAAAIGLVALLEHTDTSFHSVDSLRGFTTVPVLASIPRIDVATGADRRRRLGLVTIAALLGVVGVAVAAYLIAHGNEHLASLLSRGAS